LESRFPTKTVVFLVVLSGVLYWVIDFVDLSPAEELQLKLFGVFSNDPSSMPLHYYTTPEVVDHNIQEHIPSYSDVGKDQGVLQELDSKFHQIAFGYEVEGEHARESGFGGVTTHGCRFRSNEPCEDYFALGTSPGPNAQPWNFWGIFDGHAGRHTANYLQWTLIPHVSRALSSLPSHPGFSSGGEDAIAEVVKKTFLRLDDDMMNRAKHAANWYPAASAPAITALTPAFSGSCALLSMYDPERQKLRVACVGDSRAVLGRYDASTQSYTCIPLSKDQTGFNELEVEKITKEHPDEEGIIDPKTGRLLGIAVTRAFGDHRWKWDNDFISQLRYKFFGTAPRPNSKTPPYMTAEPVITETDIVSVDAAKDKVGRSDFMIMASDGLWDRISSEHAVELVHRWLDAKDGLSRNDTPAEPLFAPAAFPSNSMQLDRGVEFNVEKKQDVDWKATPEFFAIEDDNAAVCLARNAMGGTRKGLFLGLLSVPGPLSRNAVDDTTIMVVFFDKESEQGGKAKDKKAADGKRKWWFW
jgi:pyruvate dehydrogenase phosphatase